MVAESIYNAYEQLPKAEAGLYLLNRICSEFSRIRSHQFNRS